MGALLDEVVGPDVVAPLRAQPHARAVVQPRTAAFRLLHRHFQALSPPDACDALNAHVPAGGLQQRADAAIPVAAIGARQFDNVLNQPRFIIGRLLRPALRRSIMSKRRACATLRNIQLLLYVPDAGPATSGA